MVLECPDSYAPARRLFLESELWERQAGISEKREVGQSGGGARGASKYSLHK